MAEVDYFANVLWFVFHVVFVGYALSYLIDAYLYELQGYQWFMAPLGACTRWYFYFKKNPILKDE